MEGNVCSGWVPPPDWTIIPVYISVCLISVTKNTNSFCTKLKSICILYQLQCPQKTWYGLLMLFELKMPVNPSKLWNKVWKKMRIVDDILLCPSPFLPSWKENRLPLNLMGWLTEQWCTSFWLNFVGVELRRCITYLALNWQMLHLNLFSLCNGIFCVSKSMWFILYCCESMFYMKASWHQLFPCHLGGNMTCHSSNCLWI